MLLLLFLVGFTVACGQTASSDTVTEPESSNQANSDPEATSVNALPSQAETSEPSEVGSMSGQSEQGEAKDMLKIEIGNTVFTATLAENTSVDAFKELLKDGPLVLQMQDYAGMEKIAVLNVSLPQNNEQMHTRRVISSAIKAEPFRSTTTPIHGA